MNVWFISPAYQRYMLSDIVFHQRKLAIEHLRSLGILANAVIVADDKNLEIAERYGLHTVEQDNTYVGRKFNDGYQFAAEHGAEFFVPVGSDSWLDPTFLISASKITITASRHYQIIKRDGRKRLRLWVPRASGVTYCVPRKLLEPCGFRPVGDRLQKGCDTSTWYNLNKPVPLFSECHQFETVAFQSYPQISSYQKLQDLYGLEESDEPFAPLKIYYPSGLVNQIDEFYGDELRKIVREEVEDLLQKHGLIGRFDDAQTVV